MSLNASMYIAMFVIVLIATDTVRAVEVPESCRDEIFCTEKPDDYNQEEIDAKMKGFKLLNLNYFPETDLDDNSFDEDTSEGTNCPTISEIIKPYTVKTNFTTKLVVQSSFYEQKFRQTKCAFHLLSDEFASESQCFNGVSTSIQGKCEQKETQISIYLYNTVDKVIERHPVSIPVCCYCNIGV